MDGCAQLCKCFLILFNILFALVGFGLVSLGMWLRFGAETRGFFDIDLKTAQFTIGVAVLVGTGALMLLVAIIGDCGACNHSKSALGVFSGLLSFLIIIEISAGVMAFMWSGKVAEELANFYITIYTQYVNAQSPGQAMSLKLFHNAFECCGIGGPIELLVRDTCPEGGFLKQISFPCRIVCLMCVGVWPCPVIVVFLWFPCFLFGLVSPHHRALDQHSSLYQHFTDHRVPAWPESPLPLSSLWDFTFLKLSQ